MFCSTSIKAMTPSLEQTSRNNQDKDQFEIVRLLNWSYQESNPAPPNLAPTVLTAGTPASSRWCIFVNIGCSITYPFHSRHIVNQPISQHNYTRINFLTGEGRKAPAQRALALILSCRRTRSVHTCVQVCDLANQMV